MMLTSAKNWRQMMRVCAIVLCALYAGAALHELVPHGHGDCDSVSSPKTCSLCVLLTSAAEPAPAKTAAITEFVVVARVDVASVDTIASGASAVWHVRGPPLS